MRKLTKQITVETVDEEIIEGNLIDTVELNKIARNSAHGLTYLMNVMDVNSGKNSVYMWFMNDRTGINYFVPIRK